MPVAIILAGGLGSRLKSLTRCIPKPMVEINGKPFLSYLIKLLSDQGIKEIILSVGYKSEAIRAYFKDRFEDVIIKYAIEDQPLGTGGAIRNAMQLINKNHAFVMNGDTFFPISLSTLLDFHHSKSSCMTLALKYMKNASRYGTVTVNAEGQIIGFDEKREGRSGLINGGIYLVCRDAFEDTNLPDIFSFEVDFLRIYYSRKALYGLQFDDYFIDIGIPQDYEESKTELKKFGY